MKPPHLGGTEYGDLGWNTALYLAIGALLMSPGASKSSPWPRSVRSRLPAAATPTTDRWPATEFVNCPTAPGMAG
jgi:hypothetical protein